MNSKQDNNLIIDTMYDSPNGKLKTNYFNYKLLNELCWLGLRDDSYISFSFKVEFVRKVSPKDTMSFGTLSPYI